MLNRMSTETVATQRGKKIKELEVMVADIIQETPDTTTLLLFTGNDRMDYQAGHFLTIDPHQFGSLERFTQYLEDIKGKKEPVRAYSLASAPHERHIAITVKEERYVSKQTKYPPLLSPLLVRRTPRGTRMVVTGFTGPYTLPADIESKTDHLVHVVAGSGAVPNYGIIKDALHRGLKLRHTFICANKKAEDICFRRELDALASANPQKVKVVHTLTRETDERSFTGGIRRGRISDALFTELIPDPSSCIVYLCGPAITPWDKQAAKAAGETPAPRFLESALSLLEKRGISKDRLRHESWG
jgi:3-ketosteroid 9alpha-monooxygenase subunit B